MEKSHLEDMGRYMYFRFNFRRLGKSDEIESVETLFQGLLSKAMVEGLSSLGVKEKHRFGVVTELWW